MTDTDEAERQWLLDVGMRVRLARVAGRESQDDLALRAHVSRVTLGSIERGDHPAVILSYVRLARALGLGLGELLADAR
jgi:transcriptional regulator with XRE-family HTH domain